MVRIFIGTDFLSRDQAVAEIAAKAKAQVRRIGEGDPFPGLGQLGESPLFGPAEIFVFDGSIGKSGLLDDPDALAQSRGEIIILEEAMPKRGNALLALSKLKQVELRQFDPPSADKVPGWLEARAKNYNTAMSREAARALAAAVISEPAASWEKPAVDLRLLDSELQKLATYADGRPIAGEDVAALTKKNNATEVWHVINAIADKNGKQVFAALERFLTETEPGGDDKAKLIMLNALLADQFRNILLVQDFQDSRIPEQVVLQRTGWKSGRLFQLKKLGARFAPAQIRAILSRLENLDIELKTTSTPARPIMDLILAQVL